MLVLTRKNQQSVVIGDNIVVTIVAIHGDRVRLGIQAPGEIPVHRGEVYQRIQQEFAGGVAPWTAAPEGASPIFAAKT